MSQAGIAAQTLTLMLCFETKKRECNANIYFQCESPLIARYARGDMTERANELVKAILAR